ncbi:MAG: MBL fold metallo-hydrolase [Oscillospiraceae bacterium]
MKLTVFASSSSGNCCLIQGGGESILVDAGISAKRIREALSRAALSSSELSGIFITHEHADHIKGLSILLKNTPVPVYAPGTVAAALCRLVSGVSPYLHPFTPEEPLVLGSLTALAFPTSHDTMQSVGYRFTADGGSVAIATDTGCVTDAMLRYLPGADIALIEANHDEQMLRYGPYPAALKRRILSDEGHLSNAECTWLASVLAHSGTKQIILGHLSAHNNTPALALRTVRRGLDGSGTSIAVAPELGFLEVETAPCCV